ncbi:MAG: tail fiber domain-containing protein [Flavobacteriales bacterium]|nr:tail fiber domain-containing protein [Flavobacteriales bacterium]
MKNLLITPLVLLFFFKAQSQISDGYRLIKLHNISNVTNLNAINNSTSGNLAYNQTDKKVYKFDGTNWLPVGSLIDRDKDTYIIVDNGMDNDIVDVTIQNINAFKMKPSRLEFLNSNGSISIGEETSLANTSNQELNVFIGYKSGALNSTGYRNTAVGTRALRYNTTGVRNTAIGNKAMIENTQGYENVSVGSYSLYSNSTGYKNCGLGASSLEDITTGYRNTAIGYGTLYSVTTGSNNIGIGNRADIGDNYNNRVRIGNSNIQYGAMQVAWSVSSDSTWKRDIKPLSYGLNLINKLEVVDYIRKTNEDTEPLGREIGFIAQKLITNLQDVGYLDQGFVRNENGTYSVRYNDFIPLAIKGIQEQQALINELKNENTELKNELQNFKKRLDKLESRK